VSLSLSDYPTFVFAPSPPSFRAFFAGKRILLPKTLMRCLKINQQLRRKKTKRKGLPVGAFLQSVAWQKMLIKTLYR
jgi:hypothetical protein